MRRKDALLQELAVLKTQLRAKEDKGRVLFSNHFMRYMFNMKYSLKIDNFSGEIYGTMEVLA